jgi:hypothetical protein
MNSTDRDEHQVPDAWLRASSVAVILAALAFLSTRPASTRPARLAFDAALMTVFPSRVTLQVTPGNVPVKWGLPLAIHARLVGSRPKEAAKVEWGDGSDWQTADMTTEEDGQFYFRLDSVTTAFHYRILAGTVTSPTYSVSIATPAAPAFRQ